MMKNTFKTIMFLIILQSAAHAMGAAEDRFFSKDGSKVVLKGTSEAQLIKGSVRMNQSCQGQCSVKTVYGQVSTTGEAWVIDQKERVLILSLRGDTKVELKNKEIIVLDSGERVWISGIDSTGKAIVGVAEEMDLRTAITFEKHSFHGSVAELKKHMESLQKFWLQKRQEKAAAIAKAPDVNRVTNKPKVQPRQPSSEADGSSEPGSTDRTLDTKALYYKKVFEQ